MIEARRSQVEDVRCIVPKDIFSIEPWRDHVAWAISSSNCLTLWKDEKVLAIIGSNPIWKGVARCWAVTSDEVFTCKVGFHRFVKGLMERYCEQHGIHRLQMSVREGYEDGENWAQALGFEYESVLEKYGPNGENYIQYVRINECYL